MRRRPSYVSLRPSGGAQKRRPRSTHACCRQRGSRRAVPSFSLQKGEGGGRGGKGVGEEGVLQAARRITWQTSATGPKVKSQSHRGATAQHLLL